MSHIPACFPLAPNARETPGQHCKRLRSFLVGELIRQTHHRHTHMDRLLWYSVETSAPFYLEYKPETLSNGTAILASRESKIRAELEARLTRPRLVRANSAET